MNIPTASEMSSTLSKTLQLMLHATIAYQESSNNLAHAGVSFRADAVSIVSATEDALKHYYTNLCRNLTTAHAQGTPAEVKLDEHYYTFQQRDYYGNAIAHDCYLKAPLRSLLAKAEGNSFTEKWDLIQEVIDTIPFKLIESSLTISVQQLVGEGHRLIANKLVSDLNVTSQWRRARINRRHVICEISSASSMAYTKIEEVNRIAKALQVIQESSGLEFGDSTGSLIEALQTLKYEEAIPSRTHFGKGNSLEIHCFNEKYEFRFTHQAFDALSAFVYLHGGEDSQTAIADISSQLQAVA